ncbi:MAG: 3-deoxy-manno-octulosonate cytidylyltransferase [Candidatus Kapaibacterium sp.]
MNKIIGVIPARYASTRFPGKPLAILDGKSMIRRVYEQAFYSKLIDDVLVATDDRRILNEVINFGGNAVLTSKKHRTGTDRIVEAIKGIKCDIVVNIQGDEPFINPDIIDSTIFPLLKDKKLNVSTLAFPFTKNVKDENKVKVVFDKNNYALYFSRSVIPNNSRNKSNIIYYKHLGLYVYRKDFLLNFSRTKQSDIEKTEKLEQLRILNMGEKIKVIITKNDSISIDTLKDYKKALHYLNTKGK